jgi:putative phage-type endonuclease
MTTLTLGGSEAAAALGLNPYKSPVQLWLEKTGQVEPAPVNNDAVKWGSILEPVIAAELERDGYRIEYMGTSVEVVEGFRSCHPDGRVNDDGLLEIKTAGVRMSAAWDDGGIPTPYVIQVAHNMAVTGDQWALLACLIGGQRLEVRRIERDADLEQRILELEEQFWRHVEDGTPPPPDGSSATDEVLRRMYPGSSDGGIYQLGPDDFQLVKELRDLKAALAVTERQIGEREQQLKMLMGDHTAAAYGGAIAVRWSPVESKRVDTKQLKEEYPEVAELVTKASSYRRFTLVQS